MYNESHDIFFYETPRVLTFLFLCYLLQRKETEKNAHFCSFSFINTLLPEVFTIYFLFHFGVVAIVTTIQRSLRLFKRIGLKYDICKQILFYAVILLI